MMHTVCLKVQNRSKLKRKNGKVEEEKKRGSGDKEVVPSLHPCGEIREKLLL